MKNYNLEEIARIIEKEGKVTVSDLSRRLGVTEKTIRIYLETLEQSQILIRTHGGAIRFKHEQSGVFPENRTSYRMRLPQYKQDIAREALKYIKPNDSIILDDGTTTMELARLLGKFPVSVLTNDILIFYELMDKSNVTLSIVGGTLHKNALSQTIEGTDAINYVRKKRFDKVFLGVSTINVENDSFGIFQYGDRNLKKAYINSSDQKFILADSVKFGKSAFRTVSRLDNIDVIITDTNVSQEYIDFFENKPTKLVIAKNHY